MARGLVWFRTDLRIDDNPALSSALSQFEEVLAIYVFSEAQWALHNESNIKQEFLINNLTLLEKSLAKLSIPLMAINTESYKTLPKDLCSLAVQQKIDHAFWNNDIYLQCYLFSVIWRNFAANLNWPTHFVLAGRRQPPSV